MMDDAFIDELAWQMSVSLGDKRLQDPILTHSPPFHLSHLSLPRRLLSLFWFYLSNARHKKLSQVSLDLGLDSLFSIHKNIINEAETSWRNYSITQQMWMILWLKTRKSLAKRRHSKLITRKRTLKLQALVLVNPFSKIEGNLSSDDVLNRLHPPCIDLILLLS